MSERLGARCHPYKPDWYPDWYAVSETLIAFANGFGNGKELIPQPLEAP